MNYLKRFLTIFRDYFHNSKLKIAPEVDSKEPITRFVFSSRHIRQQGERVSSAVFMPREDNLRLSVFRIYGLINDEIWEIGERVGNKSHRKLHGRAELLAEEFKKRGLDIKADDNPPRHADIIRWPDEKAKRLSIAQELAAVSISFVIP